ncbi:Cytidine deaminase [Bertholletia excelsa]
MEGAKFVIEASEAESMARCSGLSLLQLLPTLVPSAQKLARPPISNFHVGAVGLDGDGRIFVGVNLEFPGVPLHHSVHAEQFLLTNLAAHGESRLLALAVSAAPCGHCRQFLQELRRTSDDLQILITSENPQDFKPLSSYLPDPFGPFDLLDDRTPLLLEPHFNGLSFPSKNHLNSDYLCNGYYEGSSELVSKDEGESEIPANNSNPGNGYNGYCESTELGSRYEGELEIAALEAANNSHAPYSGCPSGVALRDSEGRIYKGSYMESAAYNPSLGPVQAAVVAYLVAGGGGYERIVAGVLVEKEGAVVRQDETARLIFKLISPKCELRVRHCVSKLNGSERPLN